MKIYAVTWLDHIGQAEALNHTGADHRLISYYHSTKLSPYIAKYQREGIVHKKKKGKKK